MSIFKNLFGTRRKENNKSAKQNEMESQIVSNEKGITISNQAKVNFADYFSESDINLPEIMVINKVYDLGIGGWNIKARIYGTQENYYIDFFAVHRMTNSRHERLKPDGKLEGLEYLWEFGYQVYENDPERTEREKQKRIKENDKVIEILKKKGFY
ncbi:hypothetical protein JAO71_04135 [Olleya sp. YSTF-M6]|uniref:Uncharacterized protein n=1 Tax=Olleya sediminilitoris TaxID=2795739 RepID=A0ABS1WIP6_9FLAO|nr:hypothetical protein [Olleya sediminilitoris]MBL7558986.1 hypothetical protein [Olleya sediminilitoris]